MAEFDFEKDIEQSNWLIENMIPEGHLCVILAQAGVGKSLLVENIAVHMVHAVPFCGFTTQYGDVLLIDQDTPQDVLEKRLVQSAKALQGEQVHKLFVESMKGHSMSNGSLISVIQNHPTARLVVIDCLHSVCGRYNPNYTSDMSHWAEIKQECLTTRRTILVNHHISQKERCSVDTLMMDGTAHLAMGNSSIIQQADSYYIVGATAVEGRTDRIYLRPVSKRVSIPLKPLILRLYQTELGEKMEHEGYYEPKLDEVERDIILLFREQQLERDAQQVYDSMGHRHGIQAVRKALDKLEDKGLLLLSKHRSNLFKYRLP